VGHVSEYPVQLEKVQAPPVRAETLARDRLLDWLHVKIHRRVVLVLAEAGYGKTTLLADFTRRTRLRMFWFRLDHGDRDWLGLVAHLVASVRIHEPDFAVATTSLIRDAATANPTRAVVVDSFIRDLSSLPGEPAAFVFDDVHLVDDAPDARYVLRELLTRAPERVSFVLVSRTTPTLPFARLRALGEVSELRTADLRFVPEETERLFRETYALDLEPAVVAELSRRTEGWVASLQLVRAAIRDRNQSEIRSFVRSLSGAEGDLYDYLAEEVVGELSTALQQFLMRTSLLDVVEPVLASVAAGVTPDQTRQAIDEGEFLGLFARVATNSRDHVRAHPLVRDFLRARLGRSVGPEALIAIHRDVAAAAEGIDWRIAGHHYIAAGDLDDARRVLANAIETILAIGGYSAAEELVSALPATEPPDPNVLVIQSRLAQQSGQSELARTLAEAAYAERGAGTAAAMTLISARVLSGDIQGAAAIANELAALDGHAQLAALGRSVRLALETSVAGRLDEARIALESTVKTLRRSSSTHYMGVSYSNLGYVMKAEGNVAAALSSSNEAIAALEATSAGPELVSARLLRAWCLAHGGDMSGAREEVAVATRQARGDQSVEVAYEAGEIEALYGSPSEALRLLTPLAPELDGKTDAGEQTLVASIHGLIAAGEFSDAQALAARLTSGLRSAVAFEARRRLARALVAAATGDSSAASESEAAREWAERQGAYLWARVARIIGAAGEAKLLSAIVAQEGIRDPATLSIAADVLAAHVDELDDSSRALIASEARGRPERWRGPLRRATVGIAGSQQIFAAVLLDEIGEFEDIALLRQFARAKPAGLPPSVGRSLARRLAPIAFVEDLGRVQIAIGDRLIDGSNVRRKVLALLCLLLTRTRFAATREEVLEAIWPDLEPATALNSLNQTVYFLRRVFEPSFVEDTTPGYVGQNGETVWLDVELVQARSRRCRELIRSVGASPDPEVVAELVDEYHGRFALDFLYDDWSATYRDSLHASFLRIVEAALRQDTNTGQYARGILLAQRAMDAEPESEEIHLALLRLYRLSGSLAAAAEQYEHYARTQRELGLEPEAFDAL
jgi:LuxR family maltose regulon positive regulatory protein